MQTHSQYETLRRLIGDFDQHSLEGPRPLPKTARPLADLIDEASALLRDIPESWYGSMSPETVAIDYPYARWRRAIFELSFRPVMMREEVVTLDDEGYPMGDLKDLAGASRDACIGLRAEASETEEIKQLYQVDIDELTARLLRSAENPRPPLRPGSHSFAVLRLLYHLSRGQALTHGQILDRINRLAQETKEKEAKYLNADVFNRHVRVMIKRWGVKNAKGAGYYLPDEARNHLKTVFELS